MKLLFQRVALCSLSFSAVLILLVFASVRGYLSPRGLGIAMASLCVGGFFAFRLITIKTSSTLRASGGSSLETMDDVARHLDSMVENRNRRFRSAVTERVAQFHQRSTVSRVGRHSRQSQLHSNLDLECDSATPRSSTLSSARRKLSRTPCTPCLRGENELL